MNLYLVRGTPGSGKSTLASAMTKGNNMFHFEADMYFEDQFGNYHFDVAKIGRAHQWCQDQTDKTLGDGYDVVVSNTFTTKKELKPYFEIAAKHGIIPHVIVCQNEFQNVHSVPDETLRRMKERFTYDISSLFETEMETIS